MPLDVSQVNLTISDVTTQGVAVAVAITIFYFVIRAAKYIRYASDDSEFDDGGCAHFCAEADIVYDEVECPDCDKIWESWEDFENDGSFPHHELQDFDVEDAGAYHDTEGDHCSSCDAFFQRDADEDTCPYCGFELEEEEVES